MGQITNARKRPNTWANRYNQWVIAGKIAVVTGAMPYRDKDGVYPIYQDGKGGIHYSALGQQYLTEIGIKIKEFENDKSTNKKN